MMRGWLWLPLLLWSFACEVPVGPQEPVWGKQPCAHCAMLLNDRRAAAQAQLADGSHVFFDDIGCLLAWLPSAEGLRGSWVRDPQNEGWISASSSRYADGQHTPMDYGLLPAREGMSFEQASALVQAKSEARRRSAP